MSIIRVKTGKMSHKRERAMYQVMSTHGKNRFGKVIIIQEGVKMLDHNQLSNYTLEEAVKIYKNGLALVVG